MDAVTIATLAGVLAICLERILARFNLCHGFSHIDMAISKCCRLEVERQQSPAGSPLPSMVRAPSVAEIERRVEDVVAQIASRRGSTLLSPISSNELV